MTDAVAKINPQVTSIRSSFRSSLSRAFKRLFDITAAFWGLIFLAPFFLIIALLVRREAPGPVFYRGPRLGKGGRVFGILKFRTMKEEKASYEGPSITARDDPRITPLGKWLRDTKINELPQLWNVLVGEMSLVGPRPEDPGIAATWPEAVRREILSVRPGITSPATVAYHDEEKRLKAESVMNEYIENILPDKLRLDQLYVRHHGFFNDLDAIFWTFVILIPRLGDHRISEGWLFGGPATRFVRRHIRWTVLDFLVALAGIGVVGVLWRLGGPLDIGFWKAFQLAVDISLLFGLFNTLLGLRVVSWSRAAAEDVLRLLVSCVLVVLTVAVLEVAFIPGKILPYRFMVTAGGVVLAGFIAMRYRLRLVTGLASRWINLRRGGYGTGERVLVVGAGAGCEFATWLLRRSDFRSLYTIIGIVDDAPSKQGMRFDGVRVLGTTADIPQLVRRYDIGVIFHAISRLSPADGERILATCRRTGLRTVMLSDVMSMLHMQLTKEGVPGEEQAGPLHIGAGSFAEAAHSDFAMKDINA